MARNKPNSRATCLLEHFGFRRSLKQIYFYFNPSSVFKACFMVKAGFYHVGLFLGLLFITLMPCNLPRIF